MPDIFSTTITLNLTGTILRPDPGYNQDAVRIILDAVALCNLTEEVKRTLTEAGRIPGDIGVYLKFEDLVLHVPPPPETKLSHEVLESLELGDQARRVSTLQVYYKFEGGNVLIWHVRVDSSSSW
ncbi:hypothetical protein BDV10DRAFT_184566 [Aspergillus recurvatus]